MLIDLIGTIFIDKTTTANEYCLSVSIASCGKSYGLKVINKEQCFKNSV